METWKDVKGYEGLYQVSNEGRVKSLDRIINHKAGTHFYPGKLLKPVKTTKFGYVSVLLSNDGIKKRMLIHRLVAIAFINNTNNYPLVCHDDNNPSNNSVHNLYWGTHKMNSKQMLYEGRHGTKKYD